MIPVKMMKKVIKVTRAEDILCFPYNIFIEKNIYVHGILVNFYSVNWIWNYEGGISQTFFSEKEAVKAMRNNKIEWR